MIERTDESLARRGRQLVRDAHQLGTSSIFGCRIRETETNIVDATGNPKDLIFLMMTTINQVSTSFPPDVRLAILELIKEGCDQLITNGPLESEPTEPVEPPSRILRL